MSNYEAGFPLSIANVLSSEEKLKDILGVMIDRVETLMIENSHKENYIPPIVFSEQGKAFNVHFNYFVHCIGWACDDESIEYDFRITENSGPDVFKNAEFLVVGILENHYEIVRMNSSRINISKYKSATTIDIHKRSYSPICIKNGDNLMRFNAIHFNEIRLKRLLNSDQMSQLERVAKSHRFLQVSFGENQFQNYKKDNNIDYIDYVF